MGINIVIDQQDFGFNLKNIRKGDVVMDSDNILYIKTDLNNFVCLATGNEYSMADMKEGCHYRLVSATLFVDEIKD